MSKVKSPYVILGVKRTDSVAKIKAAFRTLALGAHPDKANSSPNYPMELLKKAFDVLSSRELRNAFDKGGWTRVEEVLLRQDVEESLLRLFKDKVIAEAARDKGEVRRLNEAIAEQLVSNADAARLTKLAKREFEQDCSKKKKLERDIARDEKDARAADREQRRRSPKGSVGGPEIGMVGGHEEHEGSRDANPEGGASDPATSEEAGSGRDVAVANPEGEPSDPPTREEAGSGGDLGVANPEGEPSDAVTSEGAETGEAVDMNTSNGNHANQDDDRDTLEPEPSISSEYVSEDHMTRHIAAQTEGNANDYFNDHRVQELEVKVAKLRKELKAEQQRREREVSKLEKELAKHRKQGSTQGSSKAAPKKRARVIDSDSEDDGGQDRQSSLKKHTCTICGSSFCRSTVLRRHMKSVHEKEEFLCDICHHVFSREDAKDRHRCQGNIG